MSIHIPKKRAPRSAASFELAAVEAEAQCDLAKLMDEDPDLVLLSDYIGGALTTEQADALEQRLTHDEALREWALPLLRTRDVMRDAKRREREASGATAQVALGRLQEHITLETQAVSAQPATAAPAPTVGRRYPLRHWIVFVATAVVIATATSGLIFAFSPFLQILNMASSARAGELWNVDWADQATAFVTVQLGDRTEIKGAGSPWIAVRKRSWFSLEDWRSTTTDVFASGESFVVNYTRPDNRDLKFSTETALVQTRVGMFNLERISACETIVYSVAGDVTVASRRALDEEVKITAGQLARVQCDGKVTKATVPMNNFHAEDHGSGTAPWTRPSPGGTRG